MMFWIMATAMASSVVWTGNEATIRTLYLPSISAETPAGTVLISSSGDMEWVEQGTVRFVPSSVPTPGGYFFAAGGHCDVDNDGVDELLSWEGPPSNLPPSDPRGRTTTFRFHDLWTGQVVRTLQPAEPVDEFGAMHCLDIDGDGNTEFVGLSGGFTSSAWISTLRIWENDGSLRSATRIPRLMSWRRLHAANLDQDPTAGSRTTIAMAEGVLWYTGGNAQKSLAIIP